MVKQNASLDASFWINACFGNIVKYVTSYFHIYAPNMVAQEIRYPLDMLGMKAFSSLHFNQLVNRGDIILQDPQTSVDWFQKGENAAIALALEQRYWLLIDDANPFHRAKSVGLSVVGTTDFTILLFDHNLLSYQEAVDAIKQTHCSKPQKREGLVMLEGLERRKRG